MICVPARRLSLLIGCAIAFLLLAPGVLGFTWLRLDDPPLEAPGDTVPTSSFSDGFESGTLAQWTNSGAAKWQVAGNRKHTGSFAAFVNAGGGGTSLLTSMAFDVSNSKQRSFQFWWQMSGGSSSIYLQLDIYDGTWHPNMWSKGPTDADNTWRLDSVDLSPYVASSTLQVRFSFTGASGSDKAWLDDVSAWRDHPAADLVDLYYSSDGTYFYLRETLAGAPDPTHYTYLVNIDKPTAGAVVPDFRAIYTQGISKLQRWNTTANAWQDVTNIQVTSGGTVPAQEGVPQPSLSAFNVTFKIRLASLANPDLMQDTDLYFANLWGIVANPPTTPPGVDHAPNTGAYHIANNNVAEVPLWPTLPVLLGALGTVVLGVLWRRGLLPSLRPQGGHRRDQG